MRSEVEIREALEVCRDKWLADSHPGMSRMTHVISAALAWALNDDSVEDRDKVAAFAAFLAEEQSLLLRARNLMTAMKLKSKQEEGGNNEHDETQN